MTYTHHQIDDVVDRDRSGVGFALQAALVRAADALAGGRRASGHGRTVDDYQRLLTPVVDVLNQLECPKSSVKASLPFELTMFDLEQLRVALLGALAETEPASIDPAQLVGVLAALEDFAGRLRLGAPNQFVDRLSAPDALQTVIEVAHDMRTPLGSILLLVDAIRREQSGPVTTVQERQLGLIYSAALGLSNITCDVVDAVRGNRLVEGRVRPFSIGEMMNSVSEIVRPVGEEKGIVIELAYPSVDGRLGYPAALHRILLNLVSNALRYTEIGKVSMGCDEPTPTTTRFWVEDTGGGIPPNVMSMITDGFPSGSAGQRFSSSGLGLAICRSLLGAMGGSLSIVTSTQGTRFSFDLELEPTR